jgi:hypothetical protein
MEKHTSFDLNAAVDRWRRSLGQSPAFRAADLDELESHLRDAVRDLESRGLSPEEAFTIGIRRIGESSALAAEFGRANGYSPWIDRVLWMLAGWVTLSTIQACVTSAEVFPEMARFMPYAQVAVLGALWLAPLVLVGLVARETGKWLQKPALAAIVSFVVLLLPAVFRFLSSVIIVGNASMWSALMKGQVVTVVMAGPGGARYFAATSLLRAAIGWSLVPLLTFILAKARLRSVPSSAR